MNSTAPATIDWYTHEFAVITATPYPSITHPIHHTVGHSSGSCPAIKGHTLPHATLADFMEANEHFDGEVEYLAPWPCGTCVTVKGAPATVGFEAPMPAFGSGTGQRTEVTPDPDAKALLAEAKAYAATYDGGFEFMLDMRVKARRGGTFTPKMVAAILRCKAADAKRAAATVAPEVPQASEDARRGALPANAFGGACRSCRGTVPAGAGKREKVEGRWTVLHATTAACIPAPGAPAPRVEAAPLPVVPEGKYAVPADAGHLSFYSVRTPTEGRWAGYTFLDLLIGSPGSWRQQRVAQDQRAAVMAKIAADPQAAAARYGHEFKTCGACDSPLSHERSRKAGYGQVCAAKRGWAW